MGANALKEYGWSSADAPCSCSFVAPRILKVVKELKILSVLDIGCGNGALCAMLHAAGFDVMGAEHDENGVRIAQEAHPGISFVRTSVYDSPDSVSAVSSEKFDCVISTEVIEHLYSPRCLPEFASAVLKPNGYLILSTPYHGYVKNLLLSLCDHWDAHHSPLWEGGHIKFWSRKSLTELLSQANYKVVKFYGVGRVPLLWKSMIIVAQKQVGRKQTI